MKLIVLGIPWSVLALALIERDEFWTSAAGFFMIAFYFMIVVYLVLEAVVDHAVYRLLDESSIGLDSRSQRRAALRASDEKYYAETFADSDDDADDKS